MIAATKRAHPDIHWRHLITESKEDRVDYLDELDFENKTTVPLVNGGKAEAKKAIDAMKKVQKSNSMELEF